MAAVPASIRPPRRNRSAAVRSPMEQFEADGIEQVDGQGGLPMIRVRTAVAEADIYLHGAHVTHYKPVGGSDVLFLSERAVFADGEAIRGGIPVCFPWFADNKPAADAPKHGIARTRPWQLVEARREGGDAVVVLRLKDDATSRRWWPHRFRFDLTVRVGATLRLEAKVTHLGDDSCRCELALHTYFKVTDAESVKLNGFDGCSYIDSIDGGQVKTQQGEPTIDGEVDRIYQAHVGEVTINDGQRTLVVSKSGSNSTVLWNPHVTKAASMSDFGDDEWRHMLCVETAAIGDHAIHLAGGETHTMSLTIG